MGSRRHSFGERGLTVENEVLTTLPFLKGRGGAYCRGCGGKILFTALDLGDLPIANELLRHRDGSLERFPLHLRICAECGLGQVEDVVTPERIFRDYRYLSSMSTTFLQHAADYVRQRVQEKRFANDDWVLEIASNDGYLLRNFLPHGIDVIGVEPAQNVAQISESLGIKTISEFFSSQLAQELQLDYGYPKLIIANNVMAHVPDLIDFVKGLAILCGDETQISIENPSLGNILMGMQFDTIYHEHYSYLTATSVAAICKSNGLSLFKVDELSIHGGSNRYWLRNSSQDDCVDPSVALFMQHEAENGLFDINKWSNYSLEVSKILKSFQEWLNKSREKDMRIYGYGAAAKASTILNSVEVEKGLIKAIADVSLEKQQRFMPPHGVEIISPEELFAQKPTDILIFPWNIKTEIAKFLYSNLDASVRLWCAIPEMHQVKPQ